MKTTKFVTVLSTFALALPLMLGTEGCSSSTKTKAKASGAKGATAAKADGQKSGSTATSKKASGTSKGTEVEGVACDAALEGTAWCGSESEIIFCAAGEWYSLDCSAVVSGSFCAEDVDLNTIDCYADVE